MRLGSDNPSACTPNGRLVQRFPSFRRYSRTIATHWTKPDEQTRLSVAGLRELSFEPAVYAAGEKVEPAVRRCRIMTDGHDFLGCTVRYIVGSRKALQMLGD
jgi:hypothetical protein